MYPTESKNGPLKLNPFVNQKTLDHNIMLKTIQNLCYNKTSAPFNMTSPFLVDNILHQQKTVNFHNQYLNQQLENYVLQRQGYSRENSPDNDDTKIEEDDGNRNEESIEESKIDDEDSKSRDEETFNAVKNEQVYYNNDYYRNDDRNEKEVLNVPHLVRRCQSCGSFDCPPFSCKKSGLRRLEELEKRFNLHSYQENSGDEAEIKEKGFTDDLVRSCEEFSEQKKPMLKFSVSAILGDREEGGAKSSNVNGEYFNLIFERI